MYTLNLEKNKTGKLPQLNIEACSRNHCCSANAAKIAHSEGGFVDLVVVQHAVSYCHLRPARLYNIFQYYLINGKIFEKKVIEYKTCILIFSTTLVRKMTDSKKN